MSQGLDERRAVHQQLFAAVDHISHPVSSSFTSSLHKTTRRQTLRSTTPRLNRPAVPSRPSRDRSVFRMRSRFLSCLALACIGIALPALAQDPVRASPDQYRIPPLTTACGGGWFSICEALRLAHTPLDSHAVDVRITQVAAGPPCPNPCYVVKDYWPFKTCKAECSQDVCKRGACDVSTQMLENTVLALGTEPIIRCVHAARVALEGWGAWLSQQLCCTPGVAFPEGCSQRPDQCWVVESLQLRTCIRDDRKCLQGYGVWGSQAACCTPGAAFPSGCRENITKVPEPCWVVDTYFPARLCRASDTLCTSEAGVQSWPSQTACCAPNAAFSEGCSPSAPQAPCWVVDSYWPARRCRQDNDIATCSRGWGVYQAENVCCAPNVAFPEGCSPPDLTTNRNLTTLLPLNMTLNMAAANAAIAAGVALTAPAGDAALQAAGALPGGGGVVPPAPLPAAVRPLLTPPAVSDVLPANDTTVAAPASPVVKRTSGGV